MFEFEFEKCTSYTNLQMEYAEKTSHHCILVLKKASFLKRIE